MYVDELPDSSLLHILSRLDDSADVARCRIASKAFNTVFPGLRSINLHWFNSSCYRVSISPSSHHVKLPFRTVFPDLISKLEAVESVCIGLSTGDDLCLTDKDFSNEWLPRVSKSLKSLSISGAYDLRESHILPLLSVYCHNLVSLKLRCAKLSVLHSLNPMPMLTSLTLALTALENENINEFNKCFPNLQVLKLVGVVGLKDPKIHLLNLKTSDVYVLDSQPSFTLITPNLITLRIGFFRPAALHVEAPMLSDFYLSLEAQEHASSFTTKRFENLKTLRLHSFYLASLLSEFPITETVENLTLDSGHKAPQGAKDSKLTLGKVFTVFPNVSSLSVNYGVWLELEACLNPQGWEILDGRKVLRTICAYLMLVDPSLAFSYVARVLDQCLILSEVSLLIHADVDSTVSKGFMSKCVARWPRLKWRWGIWRDEMEDSWLTNASSN